MQKNLFFSRKLLYYTILVKPASPPSRDGSNAKTLITVPIRMVKPLLLHNIKKSTTFPNINTKK